ncbi:MAG: phenylalanine--tRNA ligase subunit alpha [Actinobacteria bacterium]|nr:phenylalanine--tRNA ligase subunit alpha [Actinomycetota bacterium]
MSPCPPPPAQRWRPRRGRCRNGDRGVCDVSADDPTQEVSSLVAAGIERIAGSATSEEVRAIHAELLGKRSRLAELKAGMRDMDPQDRKDLGAELNRTRIELERAVDARIAELASEERRVLLAAERLDLTEFQGHVDPGHVHLVTQTWERLEDVFVGMGFTVATGPEVETDWFNFEALNLPPSHPARSLWDTLYLDTSDLPGVGDQQLLLRTHTSPVQVRTMLRSVREGDGPPIYVVCPGRTYRQDTADATHLPVFHQIEMLVVDRGITMGDLAGTIETFTKAYFGAELTSRLRPSYFPFTEPSAEVDISQPDGSWLEVGGCGMVHPNVLAACGLDPEEWSGFAFGFGIERLAKIRHGLGDIRDLITNDMRFLEQF